jgi:hypothetical protein
MPYYERTIVKDGHVMTTRTDLELLAVRTLVRPNGKVIVWQLYRDNWPGRCGKPHTGALYIDGKHFWNERVDVMKAMEPSGQLVHDSGWVRTYSEATGHKRATIETFSDWAREMDWKYNA